MNKIILFLTIVLVTFSFAEVEIIRFTPIEISSYFLALLICIEFFLEPAKLKAFIAIARQNKWLVLYMFWGFICSLLFWGGDHYPIQTDYKRIFPSVVFLVTVLLYINTEKDLARIISVWVFAGLANAVLGVSQFFFGGPHPVRPSDIALEKLDLSGEASDILVTGFFVHPNGFSQVLLPYFVFWAIYFLLSFKKPTPKMVIYFFLAVIFGFVIIATDTKGAILWSVMGILFGFLLYIVKELRRIHIFWTMWLLLIATINIFAILFVERLEINALRTLFSRLEFIVTSYNIIINHPVKGILGGGIAYWDGYVSQFATWQFTNAHNVYLNQILMYGLIGLIFLLLFLNSVIRRGLDFKCNFYTERYIFSLIGAVFALTGGYFFEPSFSYSTIKFHLLFLLSLILWFTQANHRDIAVAKS